MEPPGPKTGQFEEGKWFCACNPRRRACRFQSKRGQPENQGRWFYRCPVWKDEQGCGFFQWEDQLPADKREAATAIVRPQRAAPGPAAQVRNRIFVGKPSLRGGGSSQQDEDENDEAEETAEEEYSGDSVFGELTRKRKRDDETAILPSGTSVIRNAIDSFAISSGQANEKGEEDNNNDDMDPATQTTITPNQAVPITPSKPRANIGAGGLFTAPDTNNRLSTGNPSSKRPRTLPPTATTPTTTRIAGRGMSDDREESEEIDYGDYPITLQVLQILGNERLSAATSRAVREALNNFAVRMRGVEAGRDSAREAFKKKDEQLAARAAEIKKKDDIIEEKDAEIQRKNDEIKKKDEVIEKKVEEITKKVNEIEEKDAKISKLKEEVKDARKVFKRMSREINEHYEEYGQQQLSQE